MITDIEKVGERRDRKESGEREKEKEGERDGREGKNESGERGGGKEKGKGERERWQREENQNQQEWREKWGEGKRERRERKTAERREPKPKQNFIQEQNSLGHIFNLLDHHHSDAETTLFFQELIPKLYTQVPNLRGKKDVFLSPQNEQG